MKKLLEKLRSKKAAVTAALVAVTPLAVTVGARAEGESATAGIQSAVTTALQQTQSDAMSLIASVLPYALAIVGAVIVVTIGIRVFKKISGR